MATFWTRDHLHHTTRANDTGRFTSPLFLTGVDVTPPDPATPTPAYGTATNVPLRL